MCSKEWSNIKTIYYGNTKHDAANIGFRDKLIYDVISDINNDKENNILDLKQIDRDETIKTFNDYINKQDKTIY